MAVRLDSARDTIPGHILTLTCAEFGRLSTSFSDSMAPCPSVLTLHSPMLPSHAGRQQGQARYSVPHHAHVRPSAWPQASQGSSSASVRLDHGHSQLGLELSRKPNCLPSTSADQKQGTTAPRPRQGPPPSPWNYHLLSHIKRSQRWEYCTVSHVGYLNPWFALASGLVSPPLPFIASPFMLLSVAPTGTNTRPSVRAESFLRPSSASPSLPLVTHANIA